MRQVALRWSLVVVGLIASGSGVARADIGDELAKIVPDGILPLDRFGSSIAVAGPIALIGAPLDDEQGVDSGSVYMVDLDSGDTLAKWIPADGAAGDQFGVSIAVADGYAFVGAERDDDRGTDSGSVYVYEIASGMQVAKLAADDGAQDDRFGGAVASAGGRLLVGARHDSDSGEWSGSVYVFEVPGWAQLGKLVAEDGLPDDNFGYSIALQGSLALIGAPLTNFYNTDSGVAYLFDVSTMEQVAKLVPPSGGLSDNFGLSVALSGSMAVIGTPGDDQHGSGSGAVYLFDTGNGAQLAKLTADDASSGSKLGNAVSAYGSRVLAGAYRDNVFNPYSGSAYLFDIASGTQLAKLVPHDGAYQDHFGNAIGLWDSVAIVGAYRDDDMGEDSGSVYLFDAADGCRVDLDGDGDVDTADFLAFLNAWAGGWSLGDWDGNTRLDTRDFLAYLNDWVAGC